MDFVTRYTRITNSGRLRDRFLTAQIRQSPETKINKGDIFAVVEIANPWLPSSQIGQTIINTFAKEYYKSSNSSDLVNFELALKKVNEALARITQNGETDWIGNLNAVLAIIINGKLHLSQTGKGEAYLFRETKINHITEGLTKETQPHPLKTFSNITSGSLDSADKILLTSPNLFDYFSQETLRQIISNNKSASAATEIARRLKKEKTKNSNAIIIEILSKEEASSQIIDDQEKVIYLDEQGWDAVTQNIRKLESQTKISLLKLNKSILETYNKLRYFTKTKLIPKTKTSWQDTLKLSKKGFTKLKAKTKPTLEKTLKPISDKFSQKVQKPDKNNIFDKSLYHVHHYYEPQAKRIAPYFQKTKSGVKKAGQSLIKTYRWFMAKENRTSLYFLLIVILVIALVLSIGKLRNKQGIKAEQETNYQSLQAAKTKFQEDVKLAILYNDKNKARLLLDEITKLTESISESSDFKSEAEKLYSEAQDELDKLSSITRIKDKKQVAQFPQINDILVTKDNIFAISSNNDKIFASPRGEGFSDYQITLPTEAGNTKTMASFGDDETILVYSENKKIYKTSGSSTDDLEEIKPKDSDWQTGDKLSVFYSNIYLLNRTIGQIFKNVAGPDGYENASEFVDISKVDIKNAVSMTIDGTIYVLKNNGEVVKLSKGQEQDFKLAQIPAPNDKIQNPKEIYTDEDAESIYVLESNRLLEFDKDAEFTHQYVIDDLEKLEDFSINYKTKKIWLLDSNNVYEVNY